MIERVPARPEHLSAIFANQSDQMQADMDAVRQWWPGVDASHMESWFASTLPDPDAETAMIDGVPVGTIGWDKSQFRNWYSWSATTPEGYDPRRPAMIRVQRQFFQDVANRHPDVVLRMKPAVDVNARMIKWMKVLNFEYRAQEGYFQHGGALDNARKVGYLR